MSMGDSDGSVLEVILNTYLFFIPCVLECHFRNDSRALTLFSWLAAVGDKKIGSKKESRVFNAKQKILQFWKQLSGLSGYCNTSNNTFYFFS